MRQVTISQVLLRLKDFWFLSIQLKVNSDFQEVYRFTRSIERAVELFIDECSQEDYNEKELIRFLKQLKDEDSVKFILYKQGGYPNEINLR